MSDNRVLMALGLIGFAMSIIGFIDNYLRLIAEDAGLWQFHFIRALMIFAIFIPLISVRGLVWRPKRLGAVALRTATITVSMILYFGSLGIMPAALAGAGLFSSPIFVLLISAFVLGLPVGRWRIMAVAVGFTGVLLILRPGGDALGWTAIMPIAAGAFYAAGSIMTRSICAGESTTTLLVWMFAALGICGLTGLLVTHFWVQGAGFFTVGWQELTPRFLLLCLVQAVGSMIAVACIVRAYQIAEPSYVAIFEYSFLGFALLSGYLIYGDFPDAIGLLGLGLIVVAGVVIVLRSEKAARDA